MRPPYACAGAPGSALGNLLGTGPPPRLSGAACPASRLPDEEDLGVLRERPEVVGDDLLQPVGGLADSLHRRDLLVARVLRELEPLDAIRVVVGLVELGQLEHQ